jgi:hypothetical protein
MSEKDLVGLVDGAADGVAREVLGEWKRMGRSESWLTLPETMTFDHLPELLREIVRTALGRNRFDAVNARRVIETAAIHGETREREGFTENLLHTEYHLLRRSLWRFIREHMDGDGAIDAILRVDSLISLASLASLRGYHRNTFSSRGQWPAVLDQLASEWPLLGRPDG